MSGNGVRTVPAVPDPVADNVSAAVPGRQRVWLLNLLLLATAVTLYLAAGRYLPRPDIGVAAVPWWVLAGLFAFAEIFVVHLKFRHDAHTFSLSEIPLMLGLFCATPNSLLAAQVVGGGLVLAFHRRQPPIKLVFNLATYAESVLCAEIALHAVLGHGDPLGARAWLAGFGAAMTASLVAVPAIYLAVTLSDGRPGSKEFLRPVGFSLFAALVTSSIGLIAVEVLELHPLGELLLVIPTLGSYIAYRAYVGEREKHKSLQFLYDSTRLLHQAAELDSAVDGMLAQAREALRTDIAVLAYHSADQGIVLNRVGPATAHDRRSDPDGARFAEIRALLDHNGGGLMFREGPHTALLQRLVGEVDLQDGIIVALAGETGMIGVLMVANRLSQVGGFQPADTRLLETLAAHLSVALQNGRLEQSLAQLRLLERQLTHQANHDPLTGLANRTLFSRRVGEAVNQANRATAVMFIDIDDFKTVNDSLGHAAGDALLGAAAERISSCIRDVDLAARLGGDEFALLLEDVEGVAGVINVAERVLASLAQPVAVCGQQLAIQASLGIAIAEAGNHADLDAAVLMRNADTAMYAAKARGKAGWAQFSPEMYQAALQRQRLTHDLVGALANGEFVVHFQPMVSLVGERVVAAEALVRWNHPVKGVLAPSVFIPLAEETGHITELSKVVLRQACKQANTWPAASDGTLPAVSVNLSARDFDVRDLVSEIPLILAETGLAPERLILEITESLMLTDAEQSIATLRQLAGYGVGVALDDFGTGYSSLSYLGHLPLHWIKIAKDFVDDLGTDRTHDALARGIVELGHILEMSIIAEGIENPEQAEVLRSFGCDVGQGYVFAPALPSEQFPDWLRRHDAQRAGTDRAPSALVERSSGTGHAPVAAMRHDGRAVDEVSSRGLPVVSLRRRGRKGAAAPTIRLVKPGDELAG